VIEVKDVYISFRQAQSRSLQRAYRLPKNWDGFFLKMNPVNRELLEAITGSFNTRWQNIDMDRFFDCGFDLYGSKFTYTKFFDRKILLLYISKDKILKQQKKETLETFEKSKKFMEKWVMDRPHREDVSLVKQYCMMKDDNIKAPIRHFLKNKIDTYYITWLISRKYLKLTEEEKVLIPFVIQKYWRIIGEMKKLNGGNIYE